MTPAEAMKKWCPFARTVEVGHEALYGPFNRYHTGAVFNPGNENLCLADECACWVFTEIDLSADMSTWTGRCGLIHP